MEVLDMGINSIMYNGSITISCNEDGNLVGYALINTNNGYIPMEIPASIINNVNLNKYVLNKLYEGNKIYIYKGKAYLGKNFTEGPYCEKKVFISSYDVESLSYSELMINLNNNIKNNVYRKKRLVKIGEYYEGC